MSSNKYLFTTPNTDIQKKIDLISRENIGYVYRNEPLKIHSNWRIGGTADLLVEPTCEEQISRIVQIAKESSVPMVVIGDGTNLLFDDSGIRGIVLKLGNRFNRLSIEDTRMSAQSGLWVPRLARASAIAGLSGIEHTIGIPGTIGGLVYMNGGSLRKGIGENVISTAIITSEGGRQVLRNDECGFSYRSSIFQRLNAVIVGVELQLTKGSRRVVRSAMLDILRSRRKKFPLKYPNCGSVFESSEELYKRNGPPGKIIEELGLKGFHIGDACISDVHANYFINVNSATSKDMLKLIEEVRTKVYKKSGVWMECEVRYVSPDGQITPVHSIIESGIF